MQRWRRTNMSRLSGEVYDQTKDKVGGLVGDASGPWVWSGRVRVVEFTTRPDQRHSGGGRLV